MKSKSKMIKVIVWSLVTITLVLLPSLRRVGAQATFVVNSTADTVDKNPSDGVCADSSGHCTLRAAIMQANALPGADTITLPAGTYTLTIPGIFENGGATGDLDITTEMTINGAGSTNTIIDGASLDRVLQVVSGSVTLSGITLTRGNNHGDSGNDGLGNGGGIYNAGALALNNCSVSGNVASGHNPRGGGIYNQGILMMSRTAVSGNVTSGDNVIEGGGIYNEGGTLTLNDCTVSGNFSRIGGGFSTYGGTVTINNSTVSGNGDLGILSASSLNINNSTFSGNTSVAIYSIGTLTLNNSTVSSNTEAGIWNFGTATVKNTIVANNAVQDCNLGGTFTSLGHNLSSDGSCHLTGPGDLPNTPPNLGPLQNNGGFTKTHALLPGSPAIDAGLDCLPTDQRGVPRPQGAACDIGAYEVGTACTPPPPNMVAWWPLNETSGATVTDIVGGHNGTAQPAPIGAFAGPGPVTSAFWPPPTFQPGMVDTSLFFYGNRRIEVPSATDLEPRTGDFTIDAWVIYAASGSGQLLNVAQKNTGATAPFGNTFDGWRLVVRDSSPSQGLVSFRGSLSVGGSVEEPIAPNTWHHVAATLSTTNGFRIVKVYVDGVSFSQVGLNGDITSTAPMLIGGDGIDAGQIAVDELEIFNRAITQPEIQAIFNAGSAGKCKCVPPPSGLVSWWPGDGNANDIQDGNNGVLTNGATFAPGKVGQAFSLDGIDDFVQVSDNTNLQPAQFTLDAWVKTATIPEPIKPAFILARSGPNGFNGYDLAVNYTSGVAQLVVRSNQFTFGSASGNTNVADGNWHHVAGTYDGTTVDVYVDGVLEGATTYTAGVGYVSGDPLLIGKRQRVANTSNFNGLMDEVEIYNRALSASEIQAIFNAGSAGKCKGCANPPANMVGWWPADGNATDITPSPDNGTLNGGATFASGEVAQAFSLNGTTAYVSAPSVSKINFGTEDFSIDAWIKTTNADDVQVIVDKRVGKNGTTFTGYSLFTFNGNLAVQLADGTFLNFISTTNVADGAFHHVAVTIVRHSSTGGNLYVDGVSVLNFNPTGRPGSLTNSAELRIGRRSPNTGLGAFFNGLIDEVELFNRALADWEVEAIFEAGSQGKCKCTITCPASITKSNDLNQCGAVVTYPAPTASAGCTAICSPPSTSFFPVGTTTVTCSTTAGQSCTFIVTVNDTQPPTISASAVVVLIGAGSQCSRAYFGTTASDNCAVVTKTCSPASGSCFPVGTTTVTCTATDSSGNTATTSFTVTIPNPFDPH